MIRDVIDHITQSWGLHGVHSFANRATVLFSLWRYRGIRGFLPRYTCGLGEMFNLLLYGVLIHVKAVLPERPNQPNLSWIEARSAIRMTNESTQMILISLMKILEPLMYSCQYADMLLRNRISCTNSVSYSEHFITESC